jgi:hypothetical protein
MKINKELIYYYQRQNKYLNYLSSLFCYMGFQTGLGGPLPVGGLDHNPNIKEISILKHNKT